MAGRAGAGVELYMKVLVKTTYHYQRVCIKALMKVNEAK